MECLQSQHFLVPWLRRLWRAGGSEDENLGLYRQTRVKIKSTSPRLSFYVRYEWSIERFEVKAKERLVNDQGLVLLAQLKLFHDARLQPDRDWSPGMVNRTQSNCNSIGLNGTKSNSIHGLSSIEFGNRTKSNSHKNNRTVDLNRPPFFFFFFL